MTNHARLGLQLDPSCLARSKARTNLCTSTLDASSARALALETTAPPRLERLLNCSVAHAPILCVQASPNPEFASNPSNWAHWLFAHVFPMVTALKAAGVNDTQIFSSTVLLWHGRNRVLPKWSSRYAELMSSSSSVCRPTATLAVNTEERSARQRAFGCDVSITISTPLFAFQQPSFYAAAPWRAFARVMRVALRVPPWAHTTNHADAGPRNVLVLLRGRTPTRAVHGLHRACDASWVATVIRAAAFRVVCLWPNASQTLTSLARALSDPTTLSLVAGHGAGLANLPFLRPGGRVAEIDHIMNAHRARNMYQHIACALGHDAIKIWLNESGGRFCPQRSIACTSAVGGTTQHGCHRGYTDNVTLSESVLRDVLRGFAAAPTREQMLRSGAARDCGIGRDRERPPRWFRLDAEKARPFGAWIPQGVAGSGALHRQQLCA